MLALLLGAPAIEAQTPEADVMAVVKRLFDGMRAGDSAMVRSVFHPQVRTVSVAPRAGRVMVNIENTVDNFVKAVGTPHPDRWDERLGPELVRVDGALASVWVDYTFYLGERLSHCGVDHFLLTRLESGEWKILELADTRRTTGCPTR